MTTQASITTTPDGPYVVKGGIPLSEDAIVPSADGHHLEYHHVKDYEVQEEYRLCRCGASDHKPFCDGSHKRIGFDGTETAERAPYADRAQVYEGPALDLFDDNRCAYARLCHRKDGDVWSLTEQAEGGPLETEAIAASWHCPTGRLTHRSNADGTVFEQEFDPSIIILEDTGEGVSGPLFVRGGVPLYGADGFEYEKRNRYALCRCGGSADKPFCDATHVNEGFTDGSPALHGSWGARDESFQEPPEK